ncbi:hypothetical protein CANARDRAFT_134562 [[Candida] arabinofermentans NRRL YB-2248]|uniref:Sister chromatid cohesion protein DCC1 n=1 Tax=[Candida] arabinofermentans NRRL YB-2248 TaxID=983967 RepID=A0A1E4T3Y8_9ASCO|nr:hypothetical protein CANARDRAFT_134562 [[Candida] arabinofermentans NRRL YB-2248]
MELYTSLADNESANKKIKLQLIELNEDILKSMKNNEKLYLKSNSTKSYPVIVTDNKTYKIRKQNHSNCSMLMNMDRIHRIMDHGDKDIIMTSHERFDNQLILSVIDPVLNTSKVPVLENIEQLLTISKNNLTLSEIFTDSSCSTQQFKKLVVDQMLVDLNNNDDESMTGCYLLSENVVIDILRLILEWFAKNVDQSQISVAKDGSLESPFLQSFKIGDCVKGVIELQAEKLDHDEMAAPEEMVKSVVKKFTTFDVEIEDDNMLQKVKLKNPDVIRLFGISLLKKSFGSVPIDDFLINLKSRLPFGYNPDIKLDYLKGNYIVENVGVKQQIRYLDESDLSLDVIKRFKELFGMKREWKVEEIEPFVNRFNTKNTKCEKFLIKYAKVKKVGKKVIVTSR